MEGSETQIEINGVGRDQHPRGVKAAGHRSAKREEELTPKMDFESAFCP